jgi:hypothetical protein
MWRARVEFRLTPSVECMASHFLYINWSGMNMQVVPWRILKAQKDKLHALSRFLI